MEHVHCFTYVKMFMEEIETEPHSSIFNLANSFNKLPSTGFSVCGLGTSCGGLSAVIYIIMKGKWQVIICYAVITLRLYKAIVSLKQKHMHALYMLFLVHKYAICM